jgi:DNA-binding transcriptional regulator GbsR (MarR family)
MTQSATEDQTAVECLRAVHESMLEGLSQLVDYFGFSRVIGQLYGALLLSPNPLSLDDLKDRLQISKPSVSTNMRTLETLGAVHEVYVRGDRRKYYEADSDLWRVAQRILRSRELHDVETAVRVLEENTSRLREAMPAMSEDNRRLSGFYLERIDAMQDTFRFAQVLLEMILAQDDAPDLNDLAAHVDSPE